MSTRKLKLNWRYAIGEIILIFIGISLAIAFQNWNDNRKENRQLAGYLSTISKNLQSDVVAIEVYGNFRRQIAKNGQRHMELFLKDSVSLEVFTETSSILGESYLRLDMTGFEALKNSGYFSNLQGTEIESSLLEYYQLFNDIHEQEISFNNFVENMEYRIYNIDSDDLRNFFSASEGLQSGRTSLTRQEQKAVEIAFNNANIIAIMQRAADLNEPYLSKYDSLKSKAETLIELIDNKIN
ncbi:hypothetical protein BXY85_2561 [Roseivirga pacifica]|uniref:Uncharacterized protein n=1 Tax=Roseivirga pacifica TaxID=1267423 RepID=A0A1I0NX51_9BACT|nr:hypothetical protein [Roseivirga pacifica]RKQ51534.1 hypothetical protein BXY85_2561 [Roseivirga pacifica]SEW06427.1 hypothetical protein SAMN05216290_1543 [Roseivirga pacifica]